MNDLVETLWGQFAVETEEHLDLIEPLLARAGPEGIDGEGIAQLFRSFHSIKGLARAMDLFAMERVAHHAENLLGLVRDGGIALDAGLVDRLLEAVDSLKALRDVANATRADGVSPTDLVNSLAALFERLSGAPASHPGSAPPPPPAPIAHAPNAPAPDLHEDPEMLEIFVELVQARLPDLAGVLDPAAEEGARQTAQAAEAIGYAAGVMEFGRVAENLERLARAVPTDRQPTEVERRDILLQLGEIRAQMDLVAEATGRDVGASSLGLRMKPLIRGDLAGLLQELADAFGHIEMDAVEGDLDALLTDSDEFATVAKAVHSAFSCLGFGIGCRLLMLLADVYHRVATSDLTPTLDLFEVTRPILEAVDLRGPLLLGDDLSDVAEALEAGLSLQVRQALAVISGEALPSSGGDGLVLAGLHIKPAMVEVLSVDAQARLVAAMAPGDRYAYELMLHLESNSAAASSFVDWLSSSVEPVTNRTVLVEGESWFEFLVLAPLPPDEMRQHLSTIDPNLECLKAARQVTAEAGGAQLLGKTPVVEEVTRVSAVAPTAAPQTVVAKTAGDGKGQAASQVLRVRSETIDAFMSQISELRVAVTGITLLNEDNRWKLALAELTRLMQALPPERQVEGAAAVQTLSDYLRQVRGFDERLDSLLGRLNANALDLRVVPIDTIFNRFPRAVRDLAQTQGKEIRLALEGRDVRVDKGMVELLVDPLMHMVRNGIDHGIERPEVRKAAGKPPEANLALRAQQRGAEVVVDVVDDGRGLDVTAIGAKAVERGLVTPSDLARLTSQQVFRFIFAPGFSTVTAVTETSGRGVGMDVVLTTVNKLGGDIDITSEPGKGTTFSLRLPLSAALQSALLVDVAGQVLGIPERHVSGIATVKPDQIQHVGGQRAMVHRGGFLPIYPLAELLAMGAAPDASRAIEIVILSNGRNAIGVAVDRLLRRQELFLKDLHPSLAALPAIGGASVLGDGRVVLVLDADGLIQLAHHGARAEAAE